MLAPECPALTAAPEVSAREVSAPEVSTPEVSGSAWDEWMQTRHSRKPGRGEGPARGVTVPVAAAPGSGARPGPAFVTRFLSPDGVERPNRGDGALRPSVQVLFGRVSSCSRHDRLHPPGTGDRICALVMRSSFGVYCKKLNFKIMSAREKDFSPNSFKEQASPLNV